MRKSNLTKNTSMIFYLAVSTVSLMVFLPAPQSAAQEENKTFKPIEMQRIDTRIEVDGVERSIVAAPAPVVEKLQEKTILSQAKNVFSRPFSQFNKSKFKVSEDEMEALKDVEKFPKPFSSNTRSSENNDASSDPKSAVIIEKAAEPVQLIPRAPEVERPVIEIVRDNQKEKMFKEEPLIEMTVSRPAEEFKQVPIAEKKASKKQETQKQEVLSQAVEKIDVKKQEIPNQVLKEQAQKAQKHSKETDLELIKVREELAALEKENRALYLEARQARGQIDAAVVETSNEALKKMRAYEKKLEAVQSDNLALSREIEEMRRLQEDIKISSVDGDAEAQQSIRRYNEAEREIKRLGKLLEQQRLSHRQEKIDLENMLFDPAVTDEAQRNKLVHLENQLYQAQEKVKQEEKKVEAVSLQKEQALKKLEKDLSEAKKKEDQLKLEAQKIAAEAKKIAAAEAKLVALMEKEEALKLKEKRLQAEQKKVLAAEEKIAATQQKNRELAEAEAKLKLQEQKMLAEKARIAEVQRKEQELLRKQAQMEVQQQKMLAEKARIAEVQRKEQELLQKQAQMEVQQQKMLAEKARIAEAKRNEQKLIKAEAKKMLEAQEKKGAEKQRVVDMESARAMQAIQPAAGNAVARSSSFQQDQLKRVLNQSGLSSLSAIRKQGQGNFYWKAGGMTGKAQLANKSQNMKQFVQSYIKREKQNCRGDFASLPAALSAGQTGYELACISGVQGKSSSIVFTQKGNDIIAIAHETTADNMDAAIDARDKVASQL